MSSEVSDERNRQAFRRNASLCKHHPSWRLGPSLYSHVAIDTRPSHRTPHFNNDFSSPFEFTFRFANPIQEQHFRMPPTTPCPDAHQHAFQQMSSTEHELKCPATPKLSVAQLVSTENGLEMTAETQEPDRVSGDQITLDLHEDLADPLTLPLLDVTFNDPEISWIERIVGRSEKLGRGLGLLTPITIPQASASSMEMEEAKTRYVTMHA